MVRRVLPRGTTLPATRTTPCAAFSAVISGRSDKSMSPSRIALMRGQSVLETAARLDVLEVEDLLISRPFSHRDDAEPRRRFGMRHYHHGVVEHAQCNEAALAILEPSIFDRIGDTGEDLLRVGEIEAVLAQIGAALGFVPNDLHSTYYAYLYTYLQRRLRQMRLRPFVRGRDALKAEGRGKGKESYLTGFTSYFLLPPSSLFSHPIHSHRPRPMIQSRSPAGSQGISSVNRVTHRRYVHGSRERSL